MMLLQGPPKWFPPFSWRYQRQRYLDLSCYLQDSRLCVLAPALPGAAFQWHFCKAKPGSHECHCVTSVLLGSGFPGWLSLLIQLSQAANAGNCCSGNVHPQSVVFGEGSKHSHSLLKFRISWGGESLVGVSSSAPWVRAWGCPVTAQSRQLRLQSRRVLVTVGLGECLHS